MNLQDVKIKSQVYLLGRSWLNVLIPNWKSIFNLGKTIELHIVSSDTNLLLDELLKTYHDVFNRNHSIKDFLANIKIKEGSVS